MDLSNKEKQTIVEDYKKSVNEEVLAFIKDVLDNKTTKKYVVVSTVSEIMAKEVQDLTGKQIEGNSILLDTNAVRHIIKRHGPNGQQDNSMTDPADIARIGYVINNYDEIIYDGITTTGYTDENQNPSPILVLRKRINGTYYVIKAAGSSANKRSYIVSAYIAKA